MLLIIIIKYVNDLNSIICLVLFSKIIQSNFNQKNFINILIYSIKIINKKFPYNITSFVIKSLGLLYFYSVIFYYICNSIKIYTII